MNDIRRQEFIVYSVAWTIVFAVPIALDYLATATSSVTFSWTAVCIMWLGILPFFLLFLVHDLLLSPLLVRRKRYFTYAVCVTVLIGLLVFGLSSDLWRECRLRLSESAHVYYLMPPPPRHEPHGEAMHPEVMLEVFNPVLMVNLVVAMMMVGLNIGVKMFFKAQRDERVMHEIEHQSLEKELEYLKYQINPHFYMNTLTNIYALVDLDPKKARTAILDLSKMMRYVLREGAETFVPLAHDVDFMRHYLSLMRLRYVDGVDVEVSLPDDCGQATVPPLLFVTFVENAFKHGISYRSRSFVRIVLTVEDGNVLFRCTNSRHADDHHGTGIGLDNVRRRLHLIYGEDSLLTIEQPEGQFDVSLKIPASHDQMHCNG